MAARLREPRVRKIIEKVITDDFVSSEAAYDDDLQYVVDLGLMIKSRDGIKIANPIYQEVVPRVLTSVLQSNIVVEDSWYKKSDGTLDMPAI